MSIKSHLEKAEESARQALINALAEGEDYYLTDLFNLLNDVRKLNKKVSNTIRFTDNSSQWEEDRLEYNFNLSSDYLNRPGGDMDALDNVLDFPKGDIVINKSDDGNITFIQSRQDYKLALVRVMFSPPGFYIPVKDVVVVPNPFRVVVFLFSN